MKDKTKDLFDYDIDCYSPSNYNLKLTFHAEASLINLIWNKGKKAILRKKGLDVRKNNYDDLKAFEAPESYHKFLKITLRKQWMKCGAIFKEDGIILLSYDVTKAIFKINEKKGWDITVSMKGIYTKNE